MDQVSNPALQIPKLQSRNFDSPQCNTKKNLEEILKKRTVRSHHSTGPHLTSPSSDSGSSADLQLLSPCLGRNSESCSANATYTTVKSEERSSNSWMPVCPMETCSSSYFRTGEATTQNKLCALSNIESKDVPREQNYLTSSPNLYFFTSDKKSESAVIQSPVLKRLPLSERGKVAVSQIVDYLRHTTSRGSEDSGLEELCNMLDPDHKDISIDLETYHAIMKEWIEDCKRKWEDGATEEPTASMEDLEFKVHKNTSEAKKMHFRMNVTSGSLEAFGGDVSKGDMETSDLITCVADLQYNNQKLQEENNKLKLTLEAVDETNNKLLADNEDLQQQIKSIQHSVLKAKALEEELEEAKNNLNLLEEARQQILCQNKQLNIRNNVDTDELRKKILELSKNAAELQKEQNIKELKLTIVEYSSIIETLRAEKSKLLEDMQHMQQDLISNSLSFPLLCKFNSDISEGINSLHCELELAQSSELPMATVNHYVHLSNAVMRHTSTNSPVKQQEEASEAEELVMNSLQWVNDPEENVQQSWGRKLVMLYKYVTEYCQSSIFFITNSVACRQREIETVKQSQEEMAGRAEALGLELQKATKQLEDASKQAEDKVEAFHSACEEATSLKCKLEEAISEQQKLKDVNAALTSTCRLLQEKVEDQKSCLVMEEKSPKCTREKEEDVATSVTMEKNNDKDPAAPVSEADPAEKKVCPGMEEHKTAFQNVLKQDPVGQEKKNKEGQSEEAPAVVPSRKGSSPTAGGIKGDKSKPNELDSPNEKEVEAEFLRLSLGFKCDLFTLDKRVRLEERSRDLAEENLKKEITNALKMLEALVPLCEEDNQAQEIIKKLQKSLQFLGQYAARVASRAEMLGAINQESRVSKAVEVMIQHVENLKRMYAKEHAELEELKQVLLQNERSFSSLGDRDESTNKKLSNSFNFKPSSSLRRVSIATLPRSTGNAGTGLPLAQLHEPDGDEHGDKFNRRSSSWGRLGAKQNEKRPSLQRFVSTYAWADYEDKHAEAKCNLMSSWASHFKASFSNANKTLWVSVSILVLLAALTSFLTGLSLQRPADAAPVGTGDSWTSLQQLLWPYTGLQHNGPPPV
ncbi:Lrmp [Columba guinea]|nr:Lrmp [Columba guinea]